MSFDLSPLFQEKKAEKKALVYLKKTVIKLLRNVNISIYIYVCVCVYIYIYIYIYIYTHTEVWGAWVGVVFKALRY